jgi:hypothetical protein
MFNLIVSFSYFLLFWIASWVNCLDLDLFGILIFKAISSHLKAISNHAEAYFIFIFLNFNENNCVVLFIDKRLGKQYYCQQNT